MSQDICANSLAYCSTSFRRICPFIGYNMSKYLLHAKISARVSPFFSFSEWYAALTRIGLSSLSFGISPLVSESLQHKPMLHSFIGYASHLLTSQATRISCYAPFLAMCILVGYDSIDFAHGNASDHSEKPQMLNLYDLSNEPLSIK